MSDEKPKDDQTKPKTNVTEDGEFPPDICSPKHGWPAKTVYDTGSFGFSRASHHS